MKLYFCVSLTPITILNLNNDLYQVITIINFQLSIYLNGKSFVFKQQANKILFTKPRLKQS